MKTNVKIYAFVKEDAKILTTLQQNHEYIFIKDYEELKNHIDNTNYLDSYLLLIDLEYVINAKRVVKKHIREYLMRPWLTIIGYSNRTILLKTKVRLFHLDFIALLDDKNINAHKNILEHVKNHTNLYIENLQNNFIKACLNFHDLNKSLQEVKYLVDYIVDYYKLPIQDAADIYLATSSLVAALETDTYIKTSEILFTIFKSAEVNKLYKNYTSPKTFNEQLVSVLLKTLNLKNIDSYLTAMDMQNVNKKLIEEVAGFYESKIVVVSSYSEIDLFWEQIDGMLCKYYKNDDFGVLKHYLEIVYHALIQSLNRVGYIRAYINFNYKERISVFINLFDADHSVIQEYFELLEINENMMSKVINKDSDANSEMVLTLKLVKKAAVKTIAPVKKSGILKQTNIDTMHYKEEEKISAQEFLQEFEIDPYMLEDLNENEIEIKDILFSEEEFNDEVLDAICVVLEKYVHIFHETIEFNDLAVSLESLYKVFQRLSVNMLPKEKKEKLQFYIQGLIDDLQTWKKYIFIEPNTPDIHYLDASLLENCTSIEHFIFATPEEEAADDESDEDDLEFF